MGGKRMNIIGFLSELAYSLPNSVKIDEAIKQQSNYIQNAIKLNNSDLLKAYISEKKFYANETRVTVY